MVVPSIKATPIRTSTFGDLYRFVMIVHNQRVSGGMGRVGSRESIQTYTGYFLDEPCRMQGKDIISVNQRAHLVITNASDMVNMTGDRLITTRNVDKVSSAFANDTEQTLYRCDVSEIAPSVVDGSEEVKMFGGAPFCEPLNSTNMDGSLASISRTATHHQLGTLARGVLACERFNDVNRISQGAGLSRFQLFDDTRTKRDSLLTQFATQVYDQGASIRSNGIDMSSSMITLGDIVAQYGGDNVQLVPVAPYEREWDVNDPTLGSIESQASVVITSAIRSFCGEHRLSLLGFVYASHKGLVADRKDYRECITIGDLASESYFALTDIDAWAAMDMHEDTLRITMGQIHMAMDTFVTPVLKGLSNGQDFVLCVRNMESDRCLVNVRFECNDYGRGEIDYFEHHARLGGVISPIVGTRAAMRNNAAAVENAMGMIVAAAERVDKDYDLMGQLPDEDDNWGRDVDPIHSRERVEYNY
jgi:hypothetical protein